MDLDPSKEWECESPIHSENGGNTRNNPNSNTRGTESWQHSYREQVDTQIRPPPTMPLNTNVRDIQLDFPPNHLPSPITQSQPPPPFVGTPPARYMGYPREGEQVNIIKGQIQGPNPQRWEIGKAPEIIRPPSSPAMSTETKVECADPTNIDFTTPAPMFAIFKRLTMLESREKEKLSYKYPGVRIFPVGVDVHPYKLFAFMYSVMELLLHGECLYLLDIFGRRVAGEELDSPIFLHLNNKYFNHTARGLVRELLLKIREGAGGNGSNIGSSNISSSRQNTQNTLSRLELFQECLKGNRDYKYGLIVLAKGCLAHMHENRGLNPLHILKMESVHLTNADFQDLADAFHVKIRIYLEKQPEVFYPKYSILFRTTITMLHTQNTTFLLYKKSLFKLFYTGKIETLENIQQYLRSLPQNMQTYLRDMNVRGSNVAQLLVEQEQLTDLRVREAENSKLSLVNENKQMTKNLGECMNAMVETVQQFVQVFERYADLEPISIAKLEVNLTNCRNAMDLVRRGNLNKEIDERASAIKQTIELLRDPPFVEKMRSASEKFECILRPRVCNFCNRSDRGVLPRFKSCSKDCDLSICYVCLSEKSSKAPVMYCPKCYSVISSNDIKMYTSALKPNTGAINHQPVLPSSKKTPVLAPPKLSKMCIYCSKQAEISGLISFDCNCACHAQCLKYYVIDPVVAKNGKLSDIVCKFHPEKEIGFPILTEVDKDSAERLSTKQTMSMIGNMN